MHVLIVPSWYPTSERPVSGIFFREQAIALAKAGHKVGVVFPERKSIKRLRLERKYWRREIDTVDDHGVITFRSYGWYWFPRIPYANAELFIRDGLRLYFKYVNKCGSPDIIHAHSILYGGVVAARIRERHGIPFVVTEHSTAFLRNLIRPWQRNYLKEVFERAAKVITVSPQLGELLCERYGCPRGLLCHVPNVVNTNQFDIGEQMVSDFGERFIFLNVALMTKGKGQTCLLEGFAQAFKDDAQVELWIAGDGEERERLQELSRRLGISSQVKFLGMLTRDEVRDVMQRCHVFVLSSLHETFGVVLIEAMACGKPVIATRCGGPESIVDETNGILVEPGNSQQLSDAMLRMREIYTTFDPEKIRASCVARYSKAAVCRQLENIYTDVVACETRNKEF